MGPSPGTIVQSLSKYSLLIMAAHFQPTHAFLFQKQPRFQRAHKRIRMNCTWGTSRRTAYKLGSSRLSKKKIEAHQNRFRIIQLRTSNGIISISITVYMGHQREKKREIKPVTLNASLKERITSFSPPFPVGFITFPAVATALCLSDAHRCRCWMRVVLLSK